MIYDRANLTAALAVTTDVRRHLYGLEPAMLHLAPHDQNRSLNRQFSWLCTEVTETQHAFEATLHEPLLTTGATLSNYSPKGYEHLTKALDEASYTTLEANHLFNTLTQANPTDTPTKTEHIAWATYLYLSSLCRLLTAVRDTNPHIQDGTDRILQAWGTEQTNRRTIHNLITTHLTKEPK